MPFWIDAPDINDEIGLRLRSLLETILWRPADLEDLAQQAKLPPAAIAWSGTPSEMWHQMIRIARPPKLRRLVALVIEKVPTHEQALTRFLHEQVPGPWYVAPDAYTARLLEQGQRLGMIDRFALSQRLQQVDEGPYAVLAISGSAGTGKSHSRHLIRHVAGSSSPPVEMVMLSVKEEFEDPETVREVRAPGFAAALGVKLGVGAAFVTTVDTNTESSRVAKDLANALAERCRNAAPRPRWIFLDGLDRSGVLGDVHVFVAHLAWVAVEGELGAKTRIVVTGHSGEFADSVHDVLLTEPITQITHDHVIRFFTEIAQHTGTQMSGQEATAMAATAVAEASLTDLRELQKVVVRMARERFAP